MISTKLYIVEHIFLVFGDLSLTYFYESCSIVPGIAGVWTVWELAVITLDETGGTESLTKAMLLLPISFWLRASAIFWWRDCCSVRWLAGPIRLRTTGIKNNPWNSPNQTTRKNILKNEKNTFDFDKLRRTKATKVESPPLRTAGPIFSMVLIIRSALVPVSVINPCAIWAE